LRTLINPFGTGANVILVGSSTFAGVQRAVERLITCLSAATLPFLLDVDLDPSLARQLANWSDAPLAATLDDGKRQTHALNEDVMKVIGAYGIMYAWTGDRRYGEIARDGLLRLNAQMGGSYGDWHYRAERMLRVIPWLIAGGFLTDAEILRTDQLLLGTALGTENMWWRLRSGNPPLGHRHQGRGTFEFLLLTRYLKEQARPNAALRAQCQRWIAESQAYLDALGRAGIDDQDDESTLTNLATVFWYALGEERFDFFESGSARRAALRALALHDNMGAGAGQGGYGEGFPGMYVMQQEATVPVAAAALYYGDPHLKWILEHLPNLKSPLISGFLHFSPLFMHLFHTGDELAAAPPNNLTGLTVLPITAHQHAISTHPPEHIEYAGHSVNAPETWRRGEGIGINHLPAAQGFDKIVMRGGFSPNDAYLLLQGYQGGFRWQGHMQVANCIVRFSQAGHTFLIQNTSRHSHYQKNGLFISDGYNDTPLPPIAQHVASADFTHTALTSTRLSSFHHADWTRHLFWSKRADLFVVIDSADFTADAPYALTCTWRTPAYAEIVEGCSWQAPQGDHTFTLRWGEPLDATSEQETEQGGALPYVLRQRKGGSFKAGERVTFQNLFYVRPTSAVTPLSLHTLDTHQALVTLNGEPFAWCAVADASGVIRLADLTIHAVSVWLSREELVITGLREFSFPPLPACVGEGKRPEANPFFGFARDAGVRGNFPKPLALALDLATRELTFWADGGASVQPEISGDLASLPDLLLTELSRLRPTPAAAVPHPPLPVTWSPRWMFDAGTRLPKRIRALTVSAEPPPLDGFPDQLIDGVIAEIRQTRQQWGEADEHIITLTLDRETPIDHIRVIGDSTVEPTLRTFYQLPAITVEVDGNPLDRPLEPGSFSYKLFRDIEDRLETRVAHIDAPAKQIRVRLRGENRPLVLHEIEVYGREQVAPKVTHLIRIGASVLHANAANELLALSEDGTECWRVRLPAAVTHLSAHDLHGSGSQSICVGLLGGVLHIFSPDGTLERVLPLAQQFQARTDAYFGRVYTIHEVQVWARDEQGRAALVVGGYSTICFLDPDGEIVGHSWADGSWQSSILVAPTGDLFVRSGWNHGICVYEGKPGFAPSGETIAFGGVAQPMFRGIRKVIPFVNGATVNYQWLNGNILAAAENGIGILSTSQRDWRWTIEGGTPITACVAHRDEIIVGGADSFIAAFAQADGVPLRRLCLDAPITGLVALGNHFAVATRRGVLLLDAEWNTLHTYPHDTAHLLRLSDNRIVIVQANGTLAMLEVAP
jgi:hypothetical protein